MPPPPPVTMATLPCDLHRVSFGASDTEAFVELFAGVGGVGVQHAGDPEPGRAVEVLLQIVDMIAWSGVMPSRSHAMA